MTKKTRCKEYFEWLKRSECKKRHVILFSRIFFVLFIILAGIATGIIYQSFIELKTSKTLEIDRQTQYINKIATSGLVLLADAGKDVKYVSKIAKNLLSPNNIIRNTSINELNYFGNTRKTFYRFRIKIDMPVGNNAVNLNFIFNQSLAYQMPGGVADLVVSERNGSLYNATLEFAVNPTNFIDILRNYLKQINIVMENGNQGFPKPDPKFPAVYPKIWKRIVEKKNVTTLKTYNFNEDIYTISFLKFPSQKDFYLIIVEKTSVILREPMFKFTYKIISTSIISFVCLIALIFGSFVYSQYRVREETSRKLVKTLKSIGRKKSVLISEGNVDEFINNSSLDNGLIPELVKKYSYIDGVLSEKMARSLFFRYVQSQGESKRVVKFFSKLQSIQKQHETIKTTYVETDSALEINVSNDQRQYALEYDNGLSRLRDNLKQYFDEKYFNRFKESNLYQILVRNEQSEFGYGEIGNARNSRFSSKDS